MKYYYTYVLVSMTDGKLYVGCTSDLRRRVELHNKGRVKSTRNRRPFKLLYFEACLSEKLAFKRERPLKTGYGRAYLKKRLGDTMPASNA